MKLDANPASGTRDVLPADARRREAVFDVIRDVFARHGFEPLETPAFERLDVLTGKYGEEGDQLIFKILRRGEHAETGAADLALRYDLTVPLARVVARYGSQLPVPFKRYQIAPVWRADRPGRGRLREFVQCDVDVVGSDSLLADASTILAVCDALAGLGLAGFRVQLNSRKALRGLIEAYGVPDGLATETLVALDKLEKTGLAAMTEELRERGVPAGPVDALTDDLAGDDPAVRIRERLQASESGRAGLVEVDALLSTVGSVPGGEVVYAPVLARGLAYYTGPVFEVVHPGLGASIAAGGRYDGLIGMFADTDVPATGGSLGIERILILLEEQAPADGPPIDVVVTVLDDPAVSFRLAGQLRAGGLHVDVYAGDTERLGKQLRYADRRGARFATIRGADEIAAGTVAVKDLATGVQVAVPEAEVVDHVAALVTAPPSGDAVSGQDSTREPS